MKPSRDGLNASHSGSVIESPVTRQGLRRRRFPIRPLRIQMKGIGALLLAVATTNVTATAGEPTCVVVPNSASETVVAAAMSPRGDLYEVSISGRITRGKETVVSAGLPPLDLAIRDHEIVVVESKPPRLAVRDLQGKLNHTVPLTGLGRLRVEPVGTSLVIWPYGQVDDRGVDNYNRLLAIDGKGNSKVVNLQEAECLDLSFLGLGYIAAEDKNTIWLAGGMACRGSYWLHQYDLSGSLLQSVSHPLSGQDLMSADADAVTPVLTEVFFADGLLYVVMNSAHEKGGAGIDVYDDGEFLRTLRIPEATAGISRVRVTGRHIVMTDGERVFVLPSRRLEEAVP